MGTPTLTERLEALAAFVPHFEAADFSFGAWQESPGQIPWFKLSPEARRFNAIAYEFDWVNPDLDWPSWQQSDRAKRLLEHPETIATASVTELESLLTTHIRLERFSDGHLQAAYEAGQLTAIVRRAAALLNAE